MSTTLCGSLHFLQLLPKLRVKLNSGRAQAAILTAMCCYVYIAMVALYIELRAFNIALVCTPHNIKGRSNRFATWGNKWKHVEHHTGLRTRWSQPWLLIPTLNFNIKTTTNSLRPMNRQYLADLVMKTTLDCGILD